MVGSSFKKIKTDHELIFVGSKDYNLVSRAQTDSMISTIMPDSIIHLAAKVGGVKGNTDFVNDFFTQNIKMNTNVLECAHKYNIPIQTRLDTH